MSVKEIFVVMTFIVMAWKSLGLKWTTEELHTNGCEGQDKILMWNYSLEKNETVEDIQWYFNQVTQIAYESEYVKFLVSPLYDGRVERIGQMGILLKNLTSFDTGNYNLYLNLGPESPEITQTIFLTVFESPTYQCKPRIIMDSENVLFCFTNLCGRMHLSTEWRISEKYDFVSNASYLKINSSWNAEVVYCCLHRQYIQCQNNSFLDFCTSNFNAENNHAPDSRDTENSVNLTVAIMVTTLTIIFLSIATIISFRYRKRIHRLYGRQRMIEILDLVFIKDFAAHSMKKGAKRCKDTDKVREPNIKPETLPMMRVASFINSGELFPARFPPIRTSNRDISSIILREQDNSSDSSTQYSDALSHVSVQSESPV